MKSMLSRILLRGIGQPSQLVGERLETERTIVAVREESRDLAEVAQRSRPSTSTRCASRISRSRALGRPRPNVDEAGQRGKELRVDREVMLERVVRDLEGAVAIDRGDCFRRVALVAGRADLEAERVDESVRPIP